MTEKNENEPWFTFKNEFMAQVQQFYTLFKYSLKQCVLI